MIPVSELAKLPPAQQEVVLLEEQLRRERRRRITRMFPDTGPLRRELYPKHLSFFRAGKTFRQRAFMAGNRVGKTVAGLTELVYHMTGEYPDWWEGRRFSRPVTVWVCGDTSKTVREGLQQKLFGDWGDFGTGLLPGDRIARWSPKQGVPDTVDTFSVKHVSGGTSRGEMKSYDQKRLSFQSTERDIILLDEEPDEDIYGECLIRTATNGGMMMLTFTPLKGVSAVVTSFLQNGVPIEGRIPGSSRFLVMAGWDDVPHLSKEVREELLNEIPQHMRNARTQGIPLLGSGLVFPFAEEDIYISPFEIPTQWPQGCGMDFGWDHPWGAAKLAWDRDEDMLYVTNTKAMRQTTPVLAWSAVKSWGEWLPWAWPQDGYQHDKVSGKQVAKSYGTEGFKMLEEHAQFPDGTNGVEAGVLQMYQRFQTGKIKIFSTCNDIKPEMRTYHRKEGIIVKLNDDVICAVRYAMMMRRYFKTKPTGGRLVIHKGWKTA